jgi:N6-adenosine-specific RNA methylase IME4
MKFHKLSNIFPLLNGTELTALADDIREHGLKEEIVTYEDQILDGRNRFNACKIAKVEPRFRQYKGKDPLSIVISLNAMRRDLTTDQRACIALEILPELKRQAKERQTDVLKKGDSPVREKIPQREQGRAKEQAAERLKTNRKYIDDVEKIKETDPEKFEQIKKGEIKIIDVKNEIKKKERQKEIKELNKKIGKTSKEILNNKYNVIVIDPPWDYGNKEKYDSIGFRGTTDYPTMTIEEIKNLKIPSDENCILWLWTTNTHIKYSFEILNHWGFRDVSILTWVKNKMGVGKWLRSKTEHCIMSIKGKPVIDLSNQTTVLNADVREHSRKPNEFYLMVDELCPGNKLDYFSREDRKGWDSYGNDTKKF